MPSNADQIAGQSVDRSGQAGIVTRQQAPTRQFERSAVPLGTANPNEDMNPIAVAATDRIRANRHSRQAGSLVFGDDTGRVFVIREGSTCADRMLRTHPNWHVGTYATQPASGGRVEVPKAEQLFEDLRQHFVDLGLVKPADIYAHIRAVEG